MRWAIVAAGALLAATPPSAPASAQVVGAGRTMAARSCQACHGLDGIAKMPDAAKLAAQDATYLARQLTAFRSGERVNEQMSLIAQPLTDEQIADVAAYYNAIKIEVTSVPGK